MPIRHVVMFKWVDGIGPDHIAKLRDGLDALPPQIKEIKSYVHGSDVGIYEGNYDYVLVADFDNVDDLRTYREHPQHLQLIEDVVTGNVTDRASVQYETNSG